MDLFRDVRFAARLLIKDRWFTLMAVVVLGLGIGANNAVFTIVNAVLLRNLPVPQPDQIMFVGTRDVQGRDLGVSLRDFEDWKGATRTLSGLSFVFSGSFNVGNEGLLPDLVPGCYVSANLFRTLGVSPVLGRDFTPKEDTPGSTLVVLISAPSGGSGTAATPRVIALVLAAVGLYAVTAYAVGQHTRDIGVRMVLGAQPGQVIWPFVKQSLVQLAVGLSIGLAAAFAGGRVLQSFLVQTSTHDPVTLFSIVVLLTVVAVAACIGPVRRATRLDPLAALRHD